LLDVGAQPHPPAVRTEHRRPMVAVLGMQADDPIDVLSGPAPAHTLAHRLAASRVFTSAGVLPSAILSRVERVAVSGRTPCSSAAALLEVRFVGRRRDREPVEQEQAVGAAVVWWTGWVRAASGRDLRRPHRCPPGPAGRLGAGTGTS